MVIRCPNPDCKKQWKIDDALAGKRVLCGACRKPFVVPKPASENKIPTTPRVQPPAIGPTKNASAASIPRRLAADVGGKEMSRPPPLPRPSGPVKPVTAESALGHTPARASAMVLTPPIPNMPPIPPKGSVKADRVAGLAIEMLIAYARTLSPATFGLALVCFFLPFVHVSCSGEQVTTFSGIQLVLGTQVSEAEIKRAMANNAGVDLSADLELPPEWRNLPPPKVDPEFWAITAFAAAIVGLALSFIKNRKGWIGGVIVGVLGTAALLLLKGKIGDDIAREGRGLLEVRYAIGYGLAMIALAGAAALHGYFLLGGKKTLERQWNGILPTKT